MKGPAIEVSQLALQLGRQWILRPMSFTIAAGSLHCLIGPNGGGKTSTLRCLLGQMPHQGRILMDWQHNDTIGYVPQQLHLEKTLPLTVADFMALVSQDKPAFSGLENSRQEGIQQALERVGLAHKQKLMLGSLSGGERQRLLLAQALIPAPALLLLDEPMASLDEVGSQRFADIITSQRDEGCTVIWVNHDLQQVQALADSISIIDGGLLAHGPTHSTLTEAMLQGHYPPRPQEAD